MLKTDLDSALRNFKTESEKLKREKIKEQEVKQEGKVNEGERTLANNPQKM